MIAPKWCHQNTRVSGQLEMHHTSHTNLNPIHHPGAQITSLKYIFPTKGCSGKRWDMTWNLFICNFLAILLICTLLVKHDNKTIHNNQTPRDNQPSNQLLENQGRKKGKQWPSGRLLTIKYTHSPSNILLLKSIIPKQPNPNPTQQSATSQIESC